MTDLSPRTPLIVKKKRQRRQGRQALPISDSERVRVHAHTRPRHPCTHTPVAPVALVALTNESKSWKATDQKTCLSPRRLEGRGALVHGSSPGAAHAGTQRRAIFLGVQNTGRVHTPSGGLRLWARERASGLWASRERPGNSHAKRRAASRTAARARGRS